MSKYTVQEAKKAKGSTDWKKVEAMTDRQVNNAAMSDRDAKPLSKYQLTQLKPLKFIRHKLGL